MNVRNNRRNATIRQYAYDVALGKAKNEAEKREIAKKRNRILDTFKMFYGRKFSQEEWCEMTKKSFYSYQPTTIVTKLGGELEKKGIKKDWWIEKATKMFL